MNLQDLRYFMALAEHGHFGRAATACGISQPTLSVQVRRLEEELGVVLFERASKKVRPTAACERLLGHARVAVAEMEAMLAVARNLSDPLAGRFRLGIIPTLAPYLLPLIFEPVRDACPALEIEPWEDLTPALLERLRAHELDAALLATAVDGSDLVSQTLFVEPFLAALPPDHPLADARGRGRGRPRARHSGARGRALPARPDPCGLPPQRGARRGAARRESHDVAQHGGGRLWHDPDPGAGGRGRGGCRAGAAAADDADGADGAHRIARELFPRRAAVEAVGDVIAARLRGFAEAGTA